MFVCLYFSYVKKLIQDCNNVEDTTKLLRVNWGSYFDSALSLPSCVSVFVSFSPQNFTPIQFKDQAVVQIK